MGKDKKIILDDNVFNAANKRIEWVFDTFEQVCVSFSGGKDSSVLLHLVAEIARRRKRQVDVLFIDWEVQFQHTIDHVSRLKQQYHDIVNHFYWVALPLTTVNGVSQSQPEWMSWENGVEWVRQPPEDAITDHNFFPFYRYGMTFEEFMPEFSRWLAGNKGLITLTGIRADESLNRFLALASQRKIRYADDKPWTTVSRDGNYCIAYPLYDWKVRDIWIFNGKYKAAGNPLYDLMYRAGVPMKAMRVCEPFGPEARRGLWLYHVLEPETWSRACMRVSGAHSGAIYADQSGSFYARNTVMTKPSHLTWQEYAMFLLASMPEKTAEHYKNKIAIYLKWYRERDFPENIPDEQDKDLGGKDIPSWRRICKTLLRNDFWCRTLSFSPNKSKHYNRYLERIQKKRQMWGIL